MQDCPINSRSIRWRANQRRGFTLIELLVVITIIVILIGLLLPVVGKIRIAGQVADTKNFIAELAGAIDRYQQDFRAFPGPLANNEMCLGDSVSPATYTFPPSNFAGGFTYPTTPPPGYDTTTQTPAQAAQHFTMSENLVLGLLGGLSAQATTPGGTIYALVYDPSAVGGGAASLSTILPKRYPPYLDNKQLSWKTTSFGMTGHFQDDSGSANDSIIPEFVDRFNDPLPILYMRAKVGANPGAGAVTGDTDYGDNYNPAVTDDLSETSAPTPGPPAGFAVRAGQFDISQIIAYTAPYTGSWPSLTRDMSLASGNAPTGQSIGIGKFASGTYTTPPNGNNLYHGLQMHQWTARASAPTMTKGNSPPYYYPYDAYPYLVGTGGQVREKDSYILIAAGANRTYGTEDDICNFGTVGN